MVMDGMTLGMVIYQSVFQLDAPSIRAASSISSGTACSPAMYMIIIYPICCQLISMMRPQKPYFVSSTTAVSK